MKISEILEKYGIKAKKNLGQNFLINKGALDLIINSSNISDNFSIIEIGPGLGFLTELLVSNSKKVICIEKDAELIPILKEKFKEAKNLEIIEADALEYEVKEKKYKIIANIPYYITSPLIRHFLVQKHKPESLTLLVQKEVADRICDTKKHSILSLEVNLFARVKYIKTIKENSFYPAPKVKSAIIYLEVYKPEDKEYNDTKSAKKILEIAKLAFSNKRKMFFPTIQKKLKIDSESLSVIIKQSGLDKKIRPEDIKISDWKKIIHLLP